MCTKYDIENINRGSQHGLWVLQNALQQQVCITFISRKGQHKGVVQTKFGCEDETELLAEDMRLKKFVSFGQKITERRQGGWIRRERETRRSEWQHEYHKRR